MEQAFRIIELAHSDSECASGRPADSLARMNGERCRWTMAAGQNRWFGRGRDRVAELPGVREIETAPVIRTVKRAGMIVTRPPH
jgi:hypothetical protein